MTLCFSTDSFDPQNLTQDQAAQNYNSPLLVKTVLALLSFIDVQSASHMLPYLPKHNMSETMSGTASRPTVVAPESLDVDWLNTADRDCSL